MTTSIQSTATQTIIGAGGNASALTIDAAGLVTANQFSGNAASATTDNQHFGIGQTWQAVTRTAGVTYYNTTTN